MSGKAKNEILTFWHCGRCVAEDRPADVVGGFTERGIQVWCRTHDMQICHVGLGKMVEFYGGDGMVDLFALSDMTACDNPDCENHRETEG